MYLLAGRPPLERAIALIVSSFLFSGCATTQLSVETPTRPRMDGQPHHLFVFLDGTRNTQNDKASQTNVFRLYEMIEGLGDPHTRATYIQGVGTTDHPVLGSVLGKGMELRMKKGYAFLAENFRPGDHIYIFGFSRGAHQARALAGQIAYAGLPQLESTGEKRLTTVANQVMRVTKPHRDSRHVDDWRAWEPGKTPMLAQEIDDTYGFKMIPVEVKFLGVWDTVPGSQLIEYGECKEVEDERENKGDRYKSSAYPAIRNIAHALSADEKRSKFAPIRICGSVESRYPTLVDEVWFPGAHADVGGGYDDDKEKGLPGISFNWMLGLLKAHYPPAERLEPVYASSASLAHWSVGDSPANKGSRCVDRIVPAGATVDASIAKRTRASPVDVRAAGKVKKREYPIQCPPGGGRDI